MKDFCSVHMVIDDRGLDQRCSEQTIARVRRIYEIGNQSTTNIFHTQRQFCFALADDR